MSDADNARPGGGPSVFLSHAKADAAAVCEFHRLLVLDGFRPWLDSIDLVVGHDWQHEIQAAVRRSDCVAVFVTSSSIDHRGYAQNEIKLALDAADREPAGAIYILPVRLEDVPMPDRLSHLQWLEHREPEGFIGGKYIDLQRALLARARQLRVPAPDPVRVGAYMYKTARVPSSLGRKPLWTGGHYLVRGRNLTGNTYAGVADLQIDDDNAWLHTEIGQHADEYRGTYDGEELRLVGPHAVKYDTRDASGVLRGSWDDGGLEELIPASAFAKKVARG